MWHIDSIVRQQQADVWLMAMEIVLSTVLEEPDELNSTSITSNELSFYEKLDTK